METIGRDQALSLLDVSRETAARLDAYVALLEKWQQRINLVSRTTIPTVWHRHVLDSGQLFRLIPNPSQRLVDLGSGAGFPGMVLAIMGIEAVTLVESDARKGAFLREAARITAAPVTVVTRRIEELAEQPADFVTSRALAPLTQLLDYASLFQKPETIHLFLKGETVRNELTVAHETWRMRVKEQLSLTDPKGCILEITDLRRKPPHEHC